MRMSSVLAFGALVLLTACTGAHLDIFPPLEKPALMQERIAPELLHRDVDALVLGVKTRHPDFAGYADEAGLEQLVSEVKGAINQPMTRVEFYRHIGRLSHAFQDGHSFLIWPYQELNALREQGERLFPFAVSAGQNGVFLSHTYVAGAQSVPAGSEIKSINGVAISQIFSEAQDYVGGETPILRTAFVAERFPFMLWAVYGFVSQFDIELAYAGRLQTLHIDKHQAWTPADAPAAPGDRDVVYRSLESGIGYLDVTSFDVDPDDFDVQLEAAFDRIAGDGVRSLIVDIRRNTGGNTDTATALTRYLANKRFRLVSAMTEKLNQDNRGLFNYKGDVGEMLTTEWNDYVEPMSPSKRFTGPVVVLIGPASYSAAIVFATAMQDSQFGLLAGQATGGFANQSAQGNLFNLPHSQLRAYVATRLLLRPNGNPLTHKVLPDIPVADALGDQQQGIDTLLQHVVQHLHSSSADEQAALE